jgi:hypothetical protein
MEKWMYTGTLIDDLMAMVERAESSMESELQQASNLAFLCAMTQNEITGGNPEPSLAGVA